MNLIEKIFKSCSEKVYKTFSKNSGSMLLATSIIGTAMSSLAQAGVVLTSKKYTPTQKAFMLPQELMECALSIGVIFAITRPAQRLGLQMVKSGKVTSKELLQYMKKNNLAEKRGKMDFDLSKGIKDIINNIEKSDKFISANEGKNVLLKEHKEALQKFDAFTDAASAFTTTAATAISVAAVIPVVRNKVASVYQKKRAGVWEEQAKIFRSQNSINIGTKI